MMTSVYFVCVGGLYQTLDDLLASPEARRLADTLRKGEVAGYALVTSNGRYCFGDDLDGIEPLEAEYADNPYFVGDEAEANTIAENIRYRKVLDKLADNEVTLKVSDII